MHPFPTWPPPPPSAVTMEELQDDGEYSDIMEDMRDECGRYGTVVAVHIPRPPAPGAPPPPGLGKVLIEFTGGWEGGRALCAAAAVQAQGCLWGDAGRMQACACVHHACVHMPCLAGLAADRATRQLALASAHPREPARNPLR